MSDINLFEVGGKSTRRLYEAAEDAGAIVQEVMTADGFRISNRAPRPHHVTSQTYNILDQGENALAHNDLKEAEHQFRREVYFSSIFPWLFHSYCERSAQAGLKALSEQKSSDAVLRDLIAVPDEPPNCTRVCMEAKTPSALTAQSSNEHDPNAHNFLMDTVSHPAARARQAALVAWGTLAGGIKDIPNEFFHHPTETVNKAVGGLAAGTAASVLAAESPIIASAVLMGGSLMLGVALKNSWDKACNDHKLTQALSASWRSGDSATMKYSMKVAEQQLGPEAFSYGLGAISGGLGAKYGPSIIANPEVWGSTPPGPPWVKQANGTKIRTSEYGTTETLYPDGTHRTVRPSGYTTICRPNDEWVTVWPNGVKAIEDNKKIEIYYPSGRKVLAWFNGNRETTLPNGTVILQHPDGYTNVKRADGSRTTKRIDGTIWNKYPNGDWLEIDSMGKKTFYCNTEGRLYEVKPSGEKILLELK